MARKPSEARFSRFYPSFAMQSLVKFDLPEQSAFSQTHLSNRPLPFCCGGTGATRCRGHEEDGARIRARRLKHCA